MRNDRIAGSAGYLDRLARELLAIRTRAPQLAARGHIVQSTGDGIFGLADAGTRNQ
jgi:hypothetical protein